MAANQAGNEQSAQEASPSPEVAAAVQSALASAEADKQAAIRAAVEEVQAKADAEKNAAVQAAVETAKSQQSPAPAPLFAAPAVPGGPQQAAVQITSAENSEDDTSHVHDETVPGGLFMVGGKMVNSNGMRVNEKGQRVRSDGTTLMTAEEVLRESMELQAAQNQAIITNIAR